MNIDFAKTLSCHLPVVNRLVIVGIVMFGFISSVNGNSNEDPSSGFENVKELFDRAAEIDGLAYVLAREKLEALGDSIMPLLREKAKSENWREHFLAQLLIKRIEQPSSFAHAQAALRNHRAGITLEDGDLKYEIDGLRNDSTTSGVILDKPKGELDASCLPVVIDTLKEWQTTSEPNETTRKCQLVLTHFKDLKTAEAMLIYSDPYETNNTSKVEALKQMGKPILPLLNRLLKEFFGTRKRLTQSRVILAALETLGNEESAELLFRYLNDETRDHQLSASVCNTLGKVCPNEKGATALYNELRSLKRETDGMAVYLDVRACLLAMGQSAREILARVLMNQPDVESRLVVQGILFEMDNEKVARKFYESFAHTDDFARLLVETGSGQPYGFSGGDQFRDSAIKKEDLWKVGRKKFASVGGFSFGTGKAELLEKAPDSLLLEFAVYGSKEWYFRLLAEREQNTDAFQLLKHWLLDESTRPELRDFIIVPIAENGGWKAIEVLRERIEKFRVHESTIDYLVEASILIGDQGAGQFLENLLEAGNLHKDSNVNFEQFKVDLKQVAEILNQGPSSYPKLLELERLEFKVAAAKRLARRKNPKCVPILFEQFVSIAETEAGRRPSWRQDFDPSVNAYLQSGKAMEDLVGIGRPALDEIESVSKKSKSKFSAVLAESLKLRIANPEMHSKLKTVLSQPWPGQENRGGMSVEDYVASGKIVAAQTGVEFIPLIEANVVWGYGHPVVSVFALSEFKQERSLEFALLGLKYRPYLASEVLPRFGEAGIEAARNMAAPDPDRADFKGRRGMHRGAAGALVNEEDPLANEKILDGLKLLAEQKIDSSAARRYLNLAEKINDPRIVDQVIEAWNANDKPNALMDKAAVVLALRKYNQGKHDNGKLLRFYKKLLIRDVWPPHKERSSSRLIIQEMAKYKKEKTLDYFLEQLGDATTEAEKVSWCLALSSPIGWAEKPQEFEKQPNPWYHPKISKEKYAKLIPVVRTRIAEVLNSCGAEFDDHAAEAVFQFSKLLHDAESKLLLASWMVKTKSAPRSIVAFLGRNGGGDKRIGSQLLALYEKSNLRSYKKAYIASALGNLRHEPAIPVLESTVLNQKRKVSRDSLPFQAEVSGLGQIGKPAHESLFRIAEQSRILRTRAFAFTILGPARNEKALMPHVEFLKRLINEDQDTIEREFSKQNVYVAETSSVAKGLIHSNPDIGFSIVSEEALNSDNKALREQLAKVVDDAKKIDPEAYAKSLQEFVRKTPIE